MQQQKSFDFPQKASYSIQDFIVTKVNYLSFQKIANWPNSWNNKSYPYFLFLLGDKQSGKTHLANIWQKKSCALFVSSQDLENTLSDFNSNIIIENLDEQDFCEKDLLTLFNICNETKKYCLFTAKHFPHHFTLQDLTSRIKSIDISKIEPPDKETIKIILSKEFTNQSLQIDSKIINLIADLIPLDFYSAYKAVNLINEISLKQNKVINYSLVKKLFLDIIP